MKTLAAVNPQPTRLAPSFPNHLNSHAYLTTNNTFNSVPTKTEPGGAPGSVTANAEKWFEGSVSENS